MISLIYSFNIDRLPEINNVYSVQRKTVWKVADPYNILIIILCGSCNIELDGKNYLLNKDDAFFIPANCIYTRRPNGNEMCTIFYAHFAVDNLTPFENTNSFRNEITLLIAQIDAALLNDNPKTDAIKNMVYLNNKITATEKSDELDNFISNALKSNVKNSIESKLITTLSVCNIFAILTGLTLKQIMNESEISLVPETPQKLKKAILYIRQHYSQKITLNDLCMFCNISKQQLIRYFKEYLHTTPTAYINEFKLNKAKEYFLNSPHLSVKEVCNELGFDDQHYFSRVFSKYNNETPSQYKYRVLNFDETKQ